MMASMAVVDLLSSSLKLIGNLKTQLPGALLVGIIGRDSLSKWGLLSLLGQANRRPQVAVEQLHLRSEVRGALHVVHRRDGNLAQRLRPDSLNPGERIQHLVLPGLKRVFRELGRERFEVLPF